MRVSSGIARVRPGRRGFTLVELLVVIVIIMVLAGVLLPAVMRAVCQGRQGSMEALLTQLGQACKAYELDHAVYPESNGAFDSSVMVKALTKPSKRHGVYFEFKESQIGANGNIVNAVSQEDTVKYRNNVGIGNRDPKAKAHNKSSFDTWCQGCDGVADSINNWD